MGDDAAKKKMEKVFIIGGLSLLGKATARQLVERGHHVEFTGTTKKGLDELNEELMKLTEKKELSNSTPWRLPYLLDMANLERLNKEFKDQKVVKTNIDFDIVVVTWDIPSKSPSERTHKELHRFFTEGVLAPFLLIRRLLNSLPKTKQMRFLFSINMTQVKHSIVFKENIDSIWEGLKGDDDKDFDEFFSKKIDNKIARARAELGLAIIAKYVVGEHPDNNVKAVIVHRPDTKDKDILKAEAKDISAQVLKEFSTWAFPIYPRCYSRDILDANRCQPFINYVIRKIKKFLDYDLNVRFD